MIFVGISVYLVVYIGIFFVLINASDPSSSRQPSAQKEGATGQKQRRSERIRKKQEHMKSALTKARSQPVQSRAEKQKATEAMASGIEEAIRKPMVVPSSSSGHVDDESNSTAAHQRATAPSAGREGLLMQQVCACASCTEAAVKSYKRLVNEGKVTDFCSFNEYWLSRCLCGVQDYSNDPTDLVRFCDENPY
ncbi:hypothetical protein BJV82DRAFT_689976 [Fennellomyces sp. T-0311]|nr:hypothetical protein BJV82DRAFT_689976 [Fennellomyces sp. T-0311]